MARIRTIKPDFWSDDTITECSLSARLLFIGTWNFADDAGNLDRSAKQIKTRVFPIDNVDCEPLIVELLTHGLLIEYSVSGKKYLHIPGFAQHQLINRPSKPIVPGYEESLRTPGAFSECSVSTHAVREGKGREGKDGAGDAPSAPAQLSMVKPPASRGSRLPEDFTLTQPRREYAVSEGVQDPEREFAKFEDYWRAAPGTKGVKLDWDATWRNWVRSAVERNPRRPQQRGEDNGLPTLLG